MKYVVYKDRVTLEEWPVVFPEVLKHKTFESTHHSVIVSAGFCHKERVSGLWVAQGESLTLGIKSRPEDTALIQKVYK